MDTAISSGLPLTKKRRILPSGVSEIVAGIEQDASVQPAGSTTALRGLPNVRSKASVSPSSR